jgi:hypothetical protein
MWHRSEASPASPSRPPTLSRLFGFVAEGIVRTAAEEELPTLDERRFASLRMGALAFDA